MNHAVNHVGTDVHAKQRDHQNTHRVSEKDGTVPHWRGIYDDYGRIMVAICFNMDLGDSWEWADVPAYPSKFSDLGIRIAVNYVVYSMTH